MEISIKLDTLVRAGFDEVGNPITHSIGVMVSDEAERNEDDVDLSMRLSHAAIGTLAHTIGHLLSEQPVEVIAAALKQIGVDLEDEEEEETEREHGSWDNPMPMHSDQREYHYGWNDGTPADDEGEAGNSETRGSTKPPPRDDQIPL